MTKTSNLCMISRHSVRGDLREQRRHVVPRRRPDLVADVEVRRTLRSSGHPPPSQPQILLQFRRAQLCR